jgi:hypothetical protein
MLHRLTEKVEAAPAQVDPGAVTHWVVKLAYAISERCA